MGWSKNGLDIDVLRSANGSSASLDQFDRANRCILGRLIQRWPPRRHGEGWASDNRNDAQRSRSARDQRRIDALIKSRQAALVFDAEAQEIKVRERRGPVQDWEAIGIAQRDLVWPKLS